MVSSTNLNQSQEKAMTTDQFNQVVGAILEGKYSWACVLILRFAGYNPLHYVPYRTYNRLMKDNGQFHRPATKSRSRKKQNNTGNSKVTEAQRKSVIIDLNHCEDIPSHAHNINGGFCKYYDLDFYKKLIL